MIPTIWYSVAEKLPEKTGYYLAYKPEGFRDDAKLDFFYYNAKLRVWAEYESISYQRSNQISVSIWTDADPASWHEQRLFERQANQKAAELAAWEDVQEAIRRYNVIKSLTYEVLE